MPSPITSPSLHFSSSLAGVHHLAATLTHKGRALGGQQQHTTLGLCLHAAIPTVNTQPDLYGYRAKQGKGKATRRTYCYARLQHCCERQLWSSPTSDAKVWAEVWGRGPTLRCLLCSLLHVQLPQLYNTAWASLSYCCLHNPTPPRPTPPHPWLLHMATQAPPCIPRTLLSNDSRLCPEQHTRPSD